MAMGACALALWCAVVVTVFSLTTAYTVDCNHEYTDCDTELSKIGGEDEESLSQQQSSHSTLQPFVTKTTALPAEVTTETITVTRTSTLNPTTSTVPTLSTNDNKVDLGTTTEVTESDAILKPKPRLLDLSVDELQNFANALHNQTNLNGNKKTLSDISDVTLDVDEDDEPPKLITNEPTQKDISDKFFTNLQVPFNPLLSIDRSDEMEMCKDNEILYKVGERIDRGCEETCECTSSGSFECTLRCKHPYIRRGRRLNDPLCFESPVDECCSIIACATGSGASKPMPVDICRYGNETHAVGAKWNIGCEQTCVCEGNSIVTCGPRCHQLPPSDKCINVQDPSDECCEVQVCDVSQDAHEEPENITVTVSSPPATNTMISTTPTTIKSSVTSPTTIGFSSSAPYSEITSEQTGRSLDDNSFRPTVIPYVTESLEPIGSVKVLQNNSVQVNLMRMNDSDSPIHLMLSSDGGRTFKDVELKFSNLILNLEGGKNYILKTRETGTKFNFTITATDAATNEVPAGETVSPMRIGCNHDGRFYAVGEEFHIGCTELCECTGHETKECAALVCPSHVGLELVTKGCVRWATSPPGQPPNCCPRTARCLSDGTCHYNGVAVQNWSEVPISLTGCEKRCFCENGELDCQEICTPLPTLPPQTLRCPPNHRPAAVNLPDDDCCKQWGCLPNAENKDGFIYHTHALSSHNATPLLNFVTQVAPILPTSTTSVRPTPVTTETVNFFKHLNPVKALPKTYKTGVQPAFLGPVTYNLLEKPQNQIKNPNVTFNTEKYNRMSYKMLQPVLPAVNFTVDGKPKQIPNQKIPIFPIQNSPISIVMPTEHLDSESKTHSQNFIISDNKNHDLTHETKNDRELQSKPFIVHDSFIKQMHATVNKVPLPKVHKLNYFLPAYDKNIPNYIPFGFGETRATQNPAPMKVYFEPTYNNSSVYVNKFPNPITYKNSGYDYPIHGSHGKHVTILRNKDLKILKPPNNAKSDDLWPQQNKHVLTKEPNPYETVLFRVVPEVKNDIPNVPSQSDRLPKLSDKSYSTLDLEHMLSQMEVESEVNRNLGRSAAKDVGEAAAGPMPPAFPPKISHPQEPFIPTIPPEIRYPQEDIADYDQNNIHRPNVDPSLTGLPPGLPIPPAYGDDNKKLTVILLQSDSPTSVKMIFGLPPVLVGLRGSIDLRYTDTADEDVSHWYSQIFAPADEILGTQRLDFRLTGLKASTTYKIRGKLYLHNLPVEPESDVFTIRTLDLPSITPVEEKRREIDSRIEVMDVNDTTAFISWRHFTEDELELIDGIQVRYRPVGTPIYSMTELLHHSRSMAELIELRPGIRYEASLVLVPPPKSLTELFDPTKVEFTTSPYVDPYNWSVIVEAHAIGSGAAELSWRGVPVPAERWVRVYRAAHTCGAARKEHDIFRLATRDLPPMVTLTGLEPNTKCRVWLELILTNGKVKTSNVLEIHTKPQDSPELVDNIIEASSVAGGRGPPRGDYYGALVVVGVIAALGALTSVLLLLVVVRRHRPRSVPITPVPSAPRDSSLPPYDSPAYKLELQQETMDL